MKKVLLILITGCLIASPAAADLIYYEGCGRLVQGFGCIQFWPMFDSTQGGIFMLADIGDYEVGDFVYITGYYDPAVIVIGCDAIAMISNSIGDCETPSCCVGKRGNVNGDPMDIMDIADITALIDFLFISMKELPCPAEADLNEDETIDIGDLTWLINCAFVFPFDCVLPDCPSDTP
ncbi:MAG: hypothetical protein JSU65_13795 [Candidatus Zixiibacteriota bacterium]|nr:MAG: hypothetical protein JSU65_13795 [candidate division Zixibacteria bacterium]